MGRGSAVQAGLLLFVSGIVAGCTSTPDGPNSSDAKSGFPTDLPLPNATLPLMQLSNCTQILLTIDVPFAVAERVVPAAFTTWSFAPGLAGIFIYGLECDRLADNRTVLGNVKEYRATALVSPRNESWTSRDFYDQYVLDYATTSEEFQQYLSSFNITVDSADISIAKTNLPLESQLWRWEVGAPGWTARFNHRLRAEDTQPEQISINFWHGTGPFHRMYANKTGTVDTLLNEGVVALTGSSRLAQAIAAPAGVWKGTSYVDASWLLQMDSTTYTE